MFSYKIAIIVLRAV